MFARVSTYRAGDGEKLVEGFESVSSELEQVEGFSHAYFLVDRDSGKAVSITLWDTEEALKASQQKADELRQQGASVGGGTIESVGEFEVAMRLHARP